MTAVLDIEVATDLDALATDWQRLETTGERTPYARRAWLASWQAHVGAARGIEPRVVVVRLNDEPLLLAPFGRRRAHGLARLEWLGGEVSDYLAPLVATGCGERLASALDADDERGAMRVLWPDMLAAVRAAGAVDIVSLERQPERIGTEPNPFMALDASPHASRAHRAHLGSPLEDWCRSRRGARSLATERRKARRLAEHGEVRFHHVQATDRNASAHLEALLAHKSHAYAALGVPDLFDGRGHRDMLADLLRCAPGFAHLSVLTLDGAVVAGHFGLHDRNCLYYLFPAYDRGPLLRYSPGALLLRRLFEWGVAHGVEVVDFTVGDEPYKLDWSDESVTLHDHVCGVSAVGYAAAALERARRAAKRQLKRRPGLLEIARRLRAAGHATSSVRKRFQSANGAPPSSRRG